jgi:hypothetical protein
MERYTPYQAGTGYDWRGPYYGIRVGGPGGRIICDKFRLDRDEAVDLCEILQAEYEAGQQSQVEA